MAMVDLAKLRSDALLAAKWLARAYVSTAPEAVWQRWFHAQQVRDTFTRLCAHARLEADPARRAFAADAVEVVLSRIRQGPAGA